ISSVTNFGMFVELENTVEGLVHVSTLVDDFYHFDQRNYALIGEMTNKMYRIGEEVTISVYRVNPEERTVDFILTDM
ncbi:MAG TPA: S1 RNA-binding domain-containing protein, partial [Bacillota bacterium]|nr:S1 RNA-binding domain-containing protein [Bacillota bacterium]